jgi:hypothetical protein
MACRFSCVPVLARGQDFGGDRNGFSTVGMGCPLGVELDGDGQVSGDVPLSVEIRGAGIAG